MTLGIEVAAGQLEGRIGMHVDIEIMRVEVLSIVAADAAIVVVGLVFELTPVWVLMAASALVRSASRVTQGEVHGLLGMALLATQFLVGVYQGEASLGMLRRSHLQLFSPKAAVFGEMAIRARGAGIGSRDARKRLDESLIVG